MKIKNISNNIQNINEDKKNSEKIIEVFNFDAAENLLLYDTDLKALGKT